MTDGQDERSRSFRAELEAVICENVHAISLLLVFCVVLLFLAVISLLFVDRESSSYVILQVNFAILLPFAAVLAALFYRCTR